VRFKYAAGDRGILWAIGDPIGGLVNWIEDGKLYFHYNGFGDTVTLPGVPLIVGKHTAAIDFQALGDRQGRGRLLLDGGEPVGWTKMSPTLSFGVFEGLDVGLDRRGPVYPALHARHGVFPYTGAIRDVRIEPGDRPQR
jgi:hypothetical protein